MGLLDTYSNVGVYPEISIAVGDEAQLLRCACP